MGEIFQKGTIYFTQLKNLEPLLKVLMLHPISLRVSVTDVDEPLLTNINVSPPLSMRVSMSLSGLGELLQKISTQLVDLIIIVPSQSEARIHEDF